MSDGNKSNVVVIVYHHPEYWRVTSILITSRYDVLQEVDLLKSGGYTIDGTYHMHKPLDVLNLGAKLGVDPDRRRMFKQIIKELT